MNRILDQIQKEQMKKIPALHIGDTLKVHLKIVEGEKERTQTFSGTLIKRKGKGLTETITLRRISYGEGVERILLLNSPRIEKIEVEEQGRGHVRRAKLYYLRDRVGREAQVIDKESQAEEKAAEAAAKAKAKAEPKAKEEVKEAKPAK